jgi:hypothetical protein
MTEEDQKKALTDFLAERSNLKTCIRIAVDHNGGMTVYEQKYRERYRLTDCQR